MSAIELPPTEYRVTINHIIRQANNGFNYEVIVSWDETDVYGAQFVSQRTTWAYTRWGARRAARRLIKKWKITLLFDKKEQVETYTLQ